MNYFYLVKLSPSDVNIDHFQLKKSWDIKKIALRHNFIISPREIKYFQYLFFRVLYLPVTSDKKIIMRANFSL
jgi:hypothetical protein